MKSAKLLRISIILNIALYAIHLLAFPIVYSMVKDVYKPEDLLTFVYMYLGTGLGGLALSLVCRRVAAVGDSALVGFANRVAGGFYIISGAMGVWTMGDNPFAYLGLAIALLFLIGAYRYRSLE